MNYPNSVAQKSYFRQTPRRRNASRFVVAGTRLAMLIIPIAILVITLTLAINSNGKGSAPELDAVQPGGNGIVSGGSADGNLSVALPTNAYDVVEQAKAQAPEPERLYTDREVELIAKTVYGEALVTNSDMEMAAVVWCILNRVDSPYYPDTIEEVITQKRQFHGYSEEQPVTARIENIVRDVLDRWYAEKNGATDCGRVLPREYIYFTGDGEHNHYSTEYLAKEYWDWSLPNPYEN